MSTLKEAPPVTEEPRLRTFLIADVRGYTKFTNEHGDEAAARLAACFADVVEAEVEAFEGRVIELRGDEALVVFTSTRNALRAAVVLQGRFRQEVASHPDLPLRVGMGIDAGEAIPVKGGYRGGALNLAARLCSIAAPGEVFASEGAVHLARRMEGFDYVERGEVQLKGMPGPVRVIQVVPEGEGAERAPRFTVHVTPTTRLPAQPTPFIGREKELRGISGMLLRDDVRLLTLTGPGGTGKTRLALQVAGEVAPNFSDGVYFVSLASVSDPDLVPSAIAAELGVKEAGGESLLQLVQEYITDKRLLLLLDNFEQIVEAASLVSCLLAGASDLRIMVTSRMPLHVAGEQEYPVPTLSIPDSKHVPSFVEASEYDAVALFLARARSVKPDFELTNDNHPVVAEICRRLDGLPLAIELAAVRTRLFSPQALLGRLTRRLKFLTGGARDAPTRQQTLRGAIDWSYNLLNVEEQELFARLSVFAGGFTIDAAEAVCNADGALTADVLDGVGSLLEKSLLVSLGEDDSRFSMLETIREYAGEMLESRGEADPVQVAHARYFLTFAEEMEQAQSSHATMGLDALDRELDNVRCALTYAHSSPDPTLEFALCRHLCWFWVIRNHFNEACAWLEAALSRRGDLSTFDVAEVLVWAGQVALVRGDYTRGADLVEESLSIHRELGDPRMIAILLKDWGTALALKGDHGEAIAVLEESVEAACREEQPGLIATCKGNLGGAFLYSGEYGRASALLHEALAWGRETGSAELLGGLLVDLAATSLGRGYFDEAHTFLSEAFPLLL